MVVLLIRVINRALSGPVPPTCSINERGIPKAPRRYGPPSLWEVSLFAVSLSCVLHHNMSTAANFLLEHRFFSPFFNYILLIGDIIGFCAEM